MVASTTAMYCQPKYSAKITETMVSSRISGPIDNNMNRNRKSTPLTPRSITRLNPPVLRVM